MDVNPAPFLDEFSRLLDKICQDATELLHAQASSVFLKEADENVFVMRAAYGYNHTLIHHARYQPGEGITGWVALGNAYRANSRDEITSDRHHLGKYDKEIWGGDEHQCHSMVAVPLKMGEEVHGLIKVENKHQGKKWTPFTDADTESLSIFVRAISHVIESNVILMSALGRLYVFVLMPFQEKFNNVFECGIRPAILEVGMRCERIDLVHFTGDIMRRLYQCIAQADIVVSVMTDKNPNVFYETGYSHALGKATIPLAESVDEIPFDLRHYPHIIYNRERINDLKKALKDRLVGIRASKFASARALAPDRSP